MKRLPPPTFALAAIFLSAIPISAQSPQVTPNNATKVDERVKFSTLGHAKAKGVNLSIYFPKSWTAKDGDRPNIIQKFVAPEEGAATIVYLMIKDLPGGDSATDAERLAAISNESLKKMVPQTGKCISVSQTKIEGLPAGILEQTSKLESAGVAIQTRSISYTFFVGKKWILLQCVSMGREDDAESVDTKFEGFRPVFSQIATSIVIPDKWK